MLAALILALAIPASAPARPQSTAPAPRDRAPRRDASQVNSNGIIRGRITSLATGKPLRRAQVRLASEYGLLETPLTASTSTDGSYEFRDVAPGRYTLRVERSGYLGLTYGQRRPGEQGRSLEIADKEVVQKVDFALPRMSVISGRVLDDVNEPIAGVTVWVLQTRYVQGSRQLVATGANAPTDMTGRYRLLSLPPGDYAVMGTLAEPGRMLAIPRRSSAMRPRIFLGRPPRVRRSASSSAWPSKRQASISAWLQAARPPFVAPRRAPPAPPSAARR
jgi:hypothetical protein